VSPTEVTIHEGDFHEHRRNCHIQMETKDFSVNLKNFILFHFYGH